MNINEKFIINLNGQSYVTYEGLLDLAHQKGLESLTVEILQLPTKENGMTAICQAKAEAEGQFYSDIGDASPSSVQSVLVPHILRMASTRAKARTLRDFTNVGMTAFEELDLVNNELKNTKDEAATGKQINTIMKLSNQLGVKVETDNLTKNSAGKLISEMIDKINKK